jgi:hypothetical protein
MGMTRLLDTNIVLYHLAGRLVQPLPVGPLTVSVVTVMELLSWPELSEEAEAQVRTFLERVHVVELTSVVQECAIRLRRGHRLKLPDAIVAGTAISLNAILLTNDQALRAIPGVRAESLPVADPAR